MNSHVVVTRPGALAARPHQHWAGRAGVGLRVAALVAVLCTPAAAQFEMCVGDCDCDQVVMISELVTMINISLGDASPSECPSGDENRDQSVAVNEIVLAVKHALIGCPFIAGCVGPEPTFPVVLATAPRTRKRPAAVVTMTPTPTATPKPRPPSALRGQGGGFVSCTGDCDGDETVTVAELVTMIAIVLGERPPSDCMSGDENGDLLISVNEIVAAVDNLLNGCPFVSGCAAPNRSCTPTPG